MTGRLCLFITGFSTIAIVCGMYQALTYLLDKWNEGIGAVGLRVGCGINLHLCSVQYGSQSCFKNPFLLNYFRKWMEVLIDVLISLLITVCYLWFHIWECSNTLNSKNNLFIVPVLIIRDQSLIFRDFQEDKREVLTINCLWL